MVNDYLGHPINLGDRVIFPAGGEMMEGEVVKFGPVSKRTGKVQSIKVKNNSGYIKAKFPNVCINVSLIRESLPEYSL